MSKKRVRITVCGATGRMGREVVKACINTPNIALAGAVVGPKSQALEMDIGQGLGIGEVGVMCSARAEAETDVIVDLSTPEGTRTCIEDALRHSCGLVIGTTGHSDADQDALEDASKSIPILLAPNLSVGIHLLRIALRTLLKHMPEGDQDIEITEIHHREKRDAPSGTALSLAEEIRNLTGVKKLNFGREGEIGPRPKGEIGIHAIRMGDVVGDHHVLIGFPGERLELSHRAHSRESFAHGGIIGARFIAGATPGLYTFEDVVKENPGR